MKGESPTYVFGYWLLAFTVIALWLICEFVEFSVLTLRVLWGIHPLVSLAVGGLILAGLWHRRYLVNRRNWQLADERRARETRFQQSRPRS